MALLLCAIFSVAQPANAAEVAKFLKERFDAKAFPACNVAIAYKSGERLTFSVGNVAELNRPLESKDRMLSGSIGKSYYAAEFVRAWKKKGWSLDDPISKWVGKEDWYTWLANGDKLTPRMLLNHSACLPEYFEIPSAFKELDADPLKKWSIQDRLKHLKGQSAKGVPGKDWSYADTHYIVLGGIYERATGNSYIGETEKNIIARRGLPGTVRSESLTIKGLIAGFSTPLPPFTIKGPMVVDGKMVMNPQFEWAGGGFANTSESLARWQMLLHTGQVLDNGLTAEIQEGVPCTLGRDQKYGLGCQIRPSKFGTSFGHSGWFPGYLSDSAYFPDKGFAVAIQFNTDNVSALKGSTYSYMTKIAELISGGS